MVSVLGGRDFSGFRSKLFRVPGILFIRAGDDHARGVFRREGRVYWSRAFPVVLEKYGYLDLDVAGPAALSAHGVTDRYDLILVARQPDDFWRAELAGRLVAGRARTLVDGPLPPALLDALRVEAGGPLEPAAVFRGTDDELNEGAFASLGTAGLSRVAPMASSKEQPVDPRLHWRALGVAISEAQAAAWRVPTWDPVHWRVEPDADVLGEWDLEDGSSASPALVRRGSLVGASFGIFEYLVQCHTAAPFEQGEFLATQTSHGIEAYLLALLDRLIADAGGLRARVLPWPLGIDWALTIRHDYDRSLPLQRVAEVLDRHESAGTAATWYWRASHYKALRLARVRGRAAVAGAESADVARLVAARRRHEVALHTERLWAAGSRERRVLERAAGVRVRGTSAHGDSTCSRFQGAPNVLWAADQGLAYTENLQNFHLQPHRFVTVRADGLAEALDVLCLPKHQSFDRSTFEGETYAEHVAEVAPRYRGAGGLLQVMNHPDVHGDAFFDLLEGLPRRGRLDWTAGRIASWWQATHDSSRLRVGADPAGNVSATARLDVSNAVVELRRPDGTTTRRLLAAEAQAA